jgi:hypothetical protein
MNARPIYDLAVFNLKKYEKNTLRAFFDLQLPSGLILRGCTLHFSHEIWWVGLPAKPYTDAAGKEGWAAIVDFRDKTTKDKFQQIAVSAALESYLQMREAS